MSSLVQILNESGSVWWGWFSRAAWESTLVSLVILATVWIGRRWPSPLRYALLLIALFKFAMPPIVTLPTDVFARLGLAWPEQRRIPNGGVIGPSHAGFVLTSEEPAHGGPDLRIDATSQFQRSRPISAIRAGRAQPARVRPLGWFLLVYLAGTAGMLAWIARDWRSIRRSKCEARVVTDDWLHEELVSAARTVGLDHAPALLVSTAPASAPIAFGLLKPTILLPESIVNTLSQGELRTVLVHELAHFRRRDLWVNWLQLCLVAAWWFDPLIWLLHRALHRVREDCCDDLLLARGVTSAEGYCGVLVRAAREMALCCRQATALGFGDQVHPLGRRLARIMDEGLNRSARVSSAGRLVVLVTAALLLPSPRAQRASVQAPPAAIPTGPAARSNDQDAVTALQRARESAAATLKGYEEQSRSENSRRPPARSPQRLRVDAAIQSMSCAEIFKQWDGGTVQSARQQMLLQELVDRRDEALQFAAKTIEQTQSAQSTEAVADRCKALTFLGRQAALAPDSAPGDVALLTKMLQVSDAITAGTAARALGDCGAPGKPAIPVLLESLKRGNTEAASAIGVIHAAANRGQAAPESDEVLNALLELFRDRNRPVALRTCVLHTITCCWRCKEHRPVLEPALLAEFAAADARLQRYIAYALLQVESTSAEAAVAITRTFRDLDRVLLHDVLADLTATEAIEYIKDPRRPWEDIEASRALWSREVQASESASRMAAIPVLIAWLQDKERPVRWGAAGALGNLGPLARQATPALLEFLNEPGTGRALTINSLRRIYLPLKDSTPVPVFLALLEDEDDHVRQCAALQLKYFDAFAAQQLLDPKWQPDPVVAIHLLARTANSAAAPIDALKRIAADEDRDHQTREMAKAVLRRIQAASML